MQQLLNTLYIQTDGLVLNLDSENVVIKKDNSLLQRIPLHHLGGITIMGRSILTSPLIAKCAEDGRHISYFDSIGRFQYRIEGPVSGNVLLRQAQHDARRNQQKTEEAAKSFVIGKLTNTRSNMLRMMRERNVEDEKILTSTKDMKRDIVKLLSNEMNIDTIRGIEGMNARRYFASFGEWTRLDQRLVFSFTKRSRRPPLDRVNALISFAYRLMLNDVTAAVQG
ncbi:MAG: CRISPR-associated endonuclease Cas1, partial [Bacilli bacterium]|nr:CRISPR-associated endonuclease Cas1 [Bacilli bacterium]